MKKSPLIYINALAACLCVSCGSSPQSSSLASSSRPSSEIEQSSMDDIGLENAYLEYRDSGGALSYEDWQRYSRGEISDPGKQTSETSSFPQNDLIKIWCPFSKKEIVQSRADAFVGKYNQTSSGRQFSVQLYERPISATKTLMTGAASSMVDLYFCLSDSLSYLVNANTATRLTKTHREKMFANYGKSYTLGAKLDHDYYAFPVGSDQSYLLYYDASKYSEDDVKDWEKLIQKSEKSGLEIDYEYARSWYNFGFFYAAGADSTWKTAGLGEFVGYEDTYNSEAGMEALRALSKVIRSSSVVSNSYLSQAGEKCSALVSGFWDYEGAKERWGANLKCTELPHFTTSTGKRLHMGSFFREILLGVRPQSNDPEKEKLLLDLGEYLASPECQPDYYDPNNIDESWLPASKSAIDRLDLTSRPDYAALFAQSAYAKPQGDFPTGWWQISDTYFGKPIKTARQVNDALLHQLLSAYEAKLPRFINN